MLTTQLTLANVKVGKELLLVYLFSKLGSVLGPVIQANGRLTFEEVCYASLHSEPASTLSLPTVWRNSGMARCREMSTLPAGYIPQLKVTSASSSGLLGFIVCEQCYRMVDSVPIRHTIFIPIQPIQLTNYLRMLMRVR